MSKPRWSFFTHASTAELRFSSNTAFCSQRLSITAWLMCDYEREGFVLAHRNIHYKMAGAKSATPGNVVDLRKNTASEPLQNAKKGSFQHHASCFWKSG
jgi:hypothetical protein